jgi:hypothetical protein
MPHEISGRIAKMRFGFTRRDIHASTVTAGRVWVATPAESECAP